MAFCFISDSATLALSAKHQRGLGDLQLSVKRISGCLSGLQRKERWRTLPRLNHHVFRGELSKLSRQNGWEPHVGACHFLMNNPIS